MGELTNQTMITLEKQKFSNRGACIPGWHLQVATPNVLTQVPALLGQTSVCLAQTSLTLHPTSTLCSSRFANMIVKLFPTRTLWITINISGLSCHAEVLPLIPSFYSIRVLCRATNSRSTEHRSIRSASLCGHIPNGVAFDICHINKLST